MIYKKQEDQEGHNKIWSSWSSWSPCSNRILETLEWYWVSEQRMCVPHPANPKDLQGAHRPSHPA